MLLIGSWCLAERRAQQYLVAEQYTIWKYQVTNEEARQEAFPVVTEKLLALVLRDLQNPAASRDQRAALALALGEAGTQAAYPALRAIVQDRSQDPYLQFHCLKSLRLLQPQQFSSLLLIAPDSAVVLYRQYEPDKL